MTEKYGDHSCFITKIVVKIRRTPHARLLIVFCQFLCLFLQFILLLFVTLELARSLA